MSPVVVLVGAPGSGKSTVGGALAEHLGVAFRDTDADVEAAADFREGTDRGRKRPGPSTD